MVMRVLGAMPVRGEQLEKDHIKPVGILPPSGARECRFTRMVLYPFRFEPNIRSSISRGV